VGGNRKKSSVYFAILSIDYFAVVLKFNRASIFQRNFVTSTCIHHCRMKVNYLLCDWVFSVVSHCWNFQWHWFLWFLNLWQFRFSYYLFKSDISLFSRLRFRGFIFRFLLLLRKLFRIFLQALFSLFCFLLFTFSLFFFFLLKPFKLSFCNKLGNSHWIVPINKFFVILLIYFNSLACQKKIFKMDRLKGFECDRNCFTSFCI